MTLETRPNQLRTNGVHPAQAETIVPPPFVFPDGTTLQVSEAERKLAETIINAKKVYLDAKKADPNVKEVDYILSTPELCREIFPDISSPIVASNHLKRAATAFRRSMWQQRVDEIWQLIPVTPKLGEPSTYDLVKKDEEQPGKTGVSQPIPIEPKNGERTTQPPPPPQSDTNEREYTIPDLANGRGVTVGWMQSIIQTKYSHLGESRTGPDGIKRRYYSAKAYETITGHKPGSPPTKARPHRKGKNAPNLTGEEKRKRRESKRQQYELNAARINWADQDKQISVDFTKAILTHLKDIAFYPRPLKSLPKDFREFIDTHMPNNTSLEQLIGNGDLESLKIFVIFSFKTTLTDILNNRNEGQRGQTKEANSTVRAYGGVEKLAGDIAKHFSIHLKKPQVGIRSTSSPER